MLATNQDVSERLSELKGKNNSQFIGDIPGYNLRNDPTLLQQKTVEDIYKNTYKTSPGVTYNEEVILANIMWNKDILKWINTGVLIIIIISLLVTFIEVLRLTFIPYTSILFIISLIFYLYVDNRYVVLIYLWYTLIVNIILIIAIIGIFIFFVLINCKIIPCADHFSMLLFTVYCGFIILTGFVNILSCIAINIIRIDFIKIDMHKWQMDAFKQN